MPGAVYPRWRGEHTESPDFGALESGLSPLARGTLFAPQNAAPPLPVYPRWRGEHDANNFKLLFKFGLSPLARGTR